MKELSKPSVPTFWIAYSKNGKEVHYGVCGPNQVVTTGQDVLTTFTSEEDFLDELKSLGQTPDPDELKKMVANAQGRDYTAEKISSRTAFEQETVRSMK